MRSEKRRRGAAVWALGAMLVVAQGRAEAQPADLIVTGARIYTMEAARPTAGALAVRGDRIVAVEDSGEKLKELVGAGTRRIDAKGAVIVPGLIDSHVHLEGLGQSLEILDLTRARSVEEVAALVRAEAARRPAGQWIRGRGWDQTRWEGGEFPSGKELDEAAPRHPVYLTRVDGHASWVNAAALRAAGLTSKTQDPPGGKLLRRRDGTLSGVLIDKAQGLVAAKIPPPTLEESKRRLKRAAEECVRLGLTSVHDAGVGAQGMAAYRQLIAGGELPLRVYAMIAGEGALWKEYQRKGPEIGPWLTVRAIKLMADGALGSRGAAMLEDYADEPGNRGLSLLAYEDIVRVGREAVNGGFQVATHAIGDKANRDVLRAYAAVLGGRNDKRFRVEHAQIVAPDDFPLFAQYSIIASVQATHATSDMRWAETRVGKGRLEGAYAWRRFLDLGVALANGSDFPVEDPNPLLGFYASITRADRAGNPPGGWYPKQALTREEALHSWTLGGAYAAFEEKEKGSLAVGKLADFVMLDGDIMEIPPAEILRRRVLLTVVGGRVVHEAGR